MRGTTRQLQRMAWATAMLLAALMATAGTALATNFPAFQDAAVELGGPDFTTPVEGSRWDRALSNPESVQVDGDGKVIIADRSNDRAVVMPGMPAADGASFSHAIGNTSRFDYRFGCELYRTSAPHSAYSAGSAGGGRFAIADSSNNRVLLYNSMPAADGSTQPSIVLGQADLGSCNASGPTASGMNNPVDVWTNGTRVIVADRNNHRVMIWTSWPTANNQAANIVLGQANKTSGQADRGGTVGLGTLHSPTGVWHDGGNRIAVTDTDNHRVLLWNTFPTADGASAARVIGYGDGVTDTYQCGNARLAFPWKVSSNGTKIVVTDVVANRVTLYNSWPTTDGVTPSHILGQGVTDWCNGSRNAGGVSASSLAEPKGAWSDGTTVMVSDTGNHRVLRYAWPTNAPGTAPAAANRVIGHGNFTDHAPNDHHTSNFSIDHHYFLSSGPGSHASVSLDPAGGLWVSNPQKSTLFRWNTAPGANQATADQFWGQSSGAAWGCNGNQGAAATASSLCKPGNVWTDGTKLLIADVDNNRVKGWNTYPTSPTQNPDFVLGQTTLTGRGEGTSATTLKRPTHVQSDGTRVVVADRWNSRVLVWTSWPSGNADPADLVLGQPDFVSGNGNNGGLSAQSMSDPQSVSIWNGKLAVADQNNHRILVWNTFPTTNRQAADAVYGQSSFTTSSTSSISYPKEVVLQDNALFFTEGCDFRYLDPIPTAAVATGAKTLNGGCNNVPARNLISTPSGLAVRNGKVWVASAGTGRVLRFDDVTTPGEVVAPTVSTSCGVPTFTWTTTESGSTEVYYGPTSQATPGAYPNSSVDPTATGLTHTRTIPGISPGTYFYRVQTKDAAGNAWFSAESTFTAGAPQINDSQAGDSTWRSTNSGSYSVGFCDENALTSWETQVFTGALGTGTLQQAWTQQQALSGTSVPGPVTLAQGTWDAMAQGRNYVSVRVSNASGLQTASTDTFFVQKDTLVPNAVTAVTTNSPTGTGSPVLSWTAPGDATADATSSGVSHYRVFRSTSSGTLGTAINGTATTTTTYTDTALLSPGTYYYTVRAVDVAGNENTSTSNVQVAVEVGVTIASATPSSLAQGAQGRTVVIAGSGFSGSSVAVSGTGVTVGTVTVVNSRRIDAVISVSGTAATGPRDLTVTNAATPGGSATATAMLRIVAPSITVDTSALSYDGTSRSAPGSYRARVAADSPAGWWRLSDESGAARDESSNALHGSYVNGAGRYASGLVGHDTSRAASFDGVDDYVSVPDAAAISPTTAVTMEAWVRPDSTTGTRTIIWKECAYGLRAEAGVLTAFIADGDCANFEPRVASSTTMSAGSSYHVVVTYDQASLRMYVNGTLEATAARTVAVPDTTNQLRIGNREVGGEYWHGTVDEAAVYPRALTATEVQRHHRTTAGNSLSFGSALLPGDSREIGSTGSGQATAGPAVEVLVDSDVTYSVSTAAGNFTSGANSMPQSQLAYRLAGSADAWTAFPGTSTTIVASQSPGARTHAWDLRLSVPSAQPAGPYAATVTYSVIPGA